MDGTDADRRAEPPEDALDRAERELDVGAPERAYEVLKATGDDRSHEPRYYWLLAFSALGTRRFVEACEAAEYLLSLQPGPEHLELLAACLIEAVRHDHGGRVGLERAIELARRASELDPDRSRPHYLLIDAHLAGRQTKQAVAESDLTAIRFPESADTWYWRARAARAIGDLKTAEAALGFALELDPLHTPSAHELGAVLAAAGKSSESMRQLEFADALDQDSDIAHRRMVAYGSRPFYVACLIVTCPLAAVWPLWLLAAKGLHRSLFSARRTGPTFQRWAYAIASGMSRRDRLRGLGRKHQQASPFRPIRRQHLSSGLLFTLTAVIWLTAVPFTWAGFNQPSVGNWEVIAPTDLLALILALLCWRRTHAAEQSILDSVSAPQLLGR